MIDLNKVVTYPVVNINGTSADELVTLYRNAYEAFQPLLEAMAKATPHGRDYQTTPAGTYEKAREQHTDMVLKLVDVQDTITAIALNILQQKGD